LLEAAADFVDRELVRQSRARQFQASCRNVMRIVARESIGDPLVRSEVKALADCSGTTRRSAQPRRSAQSATSMGEELTAKIRAGDADDGTWRQEVLAVVRQSVEENCGIEPVT